MGKRKELRLPSTSTNIHLVEKFVEEISDELHLHDSYFGNILIAVTEAFQNAVHHGNKDDEKKNVHLLVESRPEGLLFSVIDQGSGFNYKDYENLDDIVARGEEAGRGLALIHSLADEVIFSNKGRVIKMLFRITGIDTAIYEKRYNQMHDYFKSHKRVGSRQ